MTVYAKLFTPVKHVEVMHGFREELSMLESTYGLACRQDVGDFARLLLAGDGPLLAVGSGASCTAGLYAAMLHERLRGHLSRSATPLEVSKVLPHLRDVHVLLLSFGGRNHDILDAFHAVRVRRPRSFTVLCGSKGTPLGNAARATDADAGLVELGLETIRDGVLGINYLLAYLVILVRAAMKAAAVPLNLPRIVAELVGASSVSSFLDDIHERTAQLWERRTTLVLHGATTRVAALDVEWKFAEAAIGNVQIMDYRNFAHGRQLWLERHGDSTAVLALVGSDDEHGARETLALLPSDVLSLALPLFAPPPLVDIAGVLTGYALAASAGRVRGIDPGRSSIPDFARRIYEWRASTDSQ